MIVPVADERPSRPRILDLRVVQVCAIHRTVIVYRRRHVEVADLLAVRIPDHIVELAIEVALWPVFRIPDDLVDEVAEMQNEAEAIIVRRALSFVDHPSVRRSSSATLSVSRVAAWPAGAASTTAGCPDAGQLRRRLPDRDRAARPTHAWRTSPRYD